MALLSSRRTFLRGGAATMAALAIRSAAGQASPPSDEFRTLRARVGGFEGARPGPTLRIKQGDELKIRFANEQARPMAVHWHGVRVPNAMDGASDLTQSLVESGSSFDYRFKAADAGTFWYRASVPGARELYGALVVDEASQPPCDGDHILIFDERLVPAPPIAAKTNDRLRLRFINATGTRILRVRLDRHPARVMAVDGQPAEPFLAQGSRFALGPGNRIDLFVDAVLAPGESTPIIAEGAAGETEIGRIVYDRGEKRRASTLPDPAPLPANPLPSRIDMKNALRTDAPLDDAVRIWASPGSIGAPLFSVKRGRAVVLTFPNRSDFATVLHPHGHSLRLLDNLDDGWKPFWLDTVVVDARQTVRVAFVADNPGKWLIERQRISGDEAASAAWFEVT